EGVASRLRVSDSAGMSAWTCHPTKNRRWNSAIASAITCREGVSACLRRGDEPADGRQWLGGADGAGRGVAPGAAGCTDLCVRTQEPSVKFRRMRSRSWNYG